MATSKAFATKIPNDLIVVLDEVCKKLGLRKNFVIEAALREKIEDLLDTYDLDQAIKESSGFSSWSDVKKGLKREGKL